MDIKKFEELHQRAIETFTEQSIRLPFLEEYCELINSWQHISDNITENDVQDIHISELFSLFWGVLGLSLLSKNQDESNNIVNICAFALITTITNSTLSIMNLVCDGLDYSANVLLRNLHETCFTLIVVLESRTKCKLYFDSAKEENEYSVWKNNFSMKKLNEELNNFEKKLIDTDPDSWYNSFIYNWRKKQYSYYSSHVHNDFIHCYLNSYCMPDCHEHMEPNIWGQKATRIGQILGQMNDLHFWTSSIFYKLLGIPGTVTKEELVKDSFDFWNEAIIIQTMARIMYDRKKLDNHRHL